MRFGRVLDCPCVMWLKQSAVDAAIRPGGFRPRVTPRSWNMAPASITLETIGLDSWEALYDKPPRQVIRLMTDKNVPVHPGDAFLAVLVIRSVADLTTATDRLEGLTKWLIGWTAALTILAVASIVIALST
jgi:hypothetical protein